MVGAAPGGAASAADGASAAGLPWLGAPLRRILAAQRAHALLLHGPRGIGELELALALAQAWLCEADDVAPAERPCRRCAGCRLVDARSHPDLLVLMPDAWREALGWLPAADEGAAEKATKAKPSRDIKVEAIRAAVAFAQTTASRGRGKVLVLHPAERMNGIAANALLKTLEEPPGDARFVLCSAAPDALPPTIRSRCQSVALGLPPVDEATAWLAGRGVADPGVLLAGAGGQPQDALALAGLGIDSAAWARLPAAVAAGNAGACKGWPLAVVVESLQKLCHDLLRTAVGAAPRYFPAAALPKRAASSPLLDWSRELNRVAADAEHPWHADLATEALVTQGRAALNPARPERSGHDVRSPPRRTDSVHFRG